MSSDTKVPAAEASSQAKTKEIPPDMVLSVKRVEEAKKDTSDRIYRVYCDGIFDLFHVGHMKMLWQAKHALGKPERTHLIVGVCTDEDTHKYKGKTVMTHAIRCESVRHCKWTDEVAEDAPWVITDSFIDKYKIDFVAHDAIPYTDHSGSADDSTDVYAGVKRKGMFLETQRTEGISTSDLIVAIVRDYDDYIERNLKRGFSEEKLNVGSSWWMRSVYHKKKKELKQSVEVTKDEYKALTDTARDFVKTFSPEGLQGATYVKKLKTNLPAPAKGIIHHAWGLTVASTQMTLHFLSYFNPFSYCRRKKYD